LTLGAEMATETVTVVFTDLVGSTALLSAVGEEAAEALRREHFALLRAVFEPVGGREVKNLGDGLMVVFASAADAVAATIAMQQGFEKRNRRAEHELVIRVGVSVGDADVEDGDYFGVPVVEAARLCARAEGGETLASEMVRLMAGSRGGFVFEPIGEVELKGLDQPVSACRVGWEPVDPSQDRALLPGRLSSAVSGTFVGRAEEHERLMMAWKAVAGQAERRVMLLSGEPGIGKTTLSARFAREVYEQGATVVYGRCDEDLGVPYQPWIEALGQLVAQAPEQVLVDHVTDCGGQLARLVPELAKRVAVDRTAAGDGDSDRFVLFGCVTDLLERLSSEDPVLVVLDDLHWADRATVQLLRHVVTAESPMRAGVLGTYRDSEIGVDHPVAELLAKLHRDGGVERIAVQGLSDVDLLGLLEEVAGHEMTDEGLALRDAVLAETAGNPFFVGEILRHLAETGTIFQDDQGRWVSDVDLRAVGLPVSVKEVVGRRLAGLGPDTDRVLSFAAVIGRDFDIPLLAAVVQIEEDPLVDLCDAAVAAAVLQTTDQPDRYTFAHALIEHTLYDGLSPSRRSRAHRAIAEQLESLHGDTPGERSGELAHHWAAAVQPSDTAKAIHYAHIAAARALDQLAPDEALRWYAQALELLDRGLGGEPRQRAELLLGLGDAQKQCGVPAYRDTLIEAAHLADRIGDVTLLVEAALTTNRGFQSVIGDVDAERVAVIELALSRLQDPDCAERAQLLGLSCQEQIHVLELDDRLAIAEEAIATARRSAGPVALLDTLQTCGGGVHCAQTFELRRSWTAERCELADALDDPVRRFRAHLALELMELEAGHSGTLRSNQALLENLAARAPHANIRWNLAFSRVTEPLLRGDLGEAERLADIGFELGNETGQPDPMGIYAAQLVNIRLHQGRYAELVPLVEQVVADQPKQPVYRAVLSAAYTYAGDLDRASALLDEDRARGFALPLDNSWTTGLCCWADVGVRLGDRVAAQILFDQLAPYHHHVPFTTITILPTVAHYLGTLDHLLDRHDGADAWFREAMTIHERMESPLLVAYTQAAWASLLADRGHHDDSTRAREMAHQALTAATAGGFGYIESDARAVLDRIE
jgi:class 3 adenylate cyclase/tetratricopeptide (TPR) repeat protein